MSDPTAPSAPLILAADAGNAAQTEPIAAPLSRRTALAAGASLGLFALALDLAAADDVAAAGESTMQSGWRLCPKCGGMFYSPKNKAAGSCPRGGKHTPLKALNYLLIRVRGNLPHSDLAAFFSQCEKCGGLFGHAEPTASVGTCPRGGPHRRRSASAPTFQFWTDVPVPIIMDPSWKYCTKCAGIFKLNGSAAGLCPADDQPHTGSSPNLAPLLLTT